MVTKHPRKPIPLQKLQMSGNFVKMKRSSMSHANPVIFVAAILSAINDSIMYSDNSCSDNSYNDNSCSHTNDRIVCGSVDLKRKGLTILYLRSSATQSRINIDTIEIK